MTEAKKPVQESEKYKKVAEGMPTHETMDRLTVFLYLLMRDSVTPGVVMQHAIDSQGEGPTTLSNGYLAKYAEHLAHKLRSPMKQQEEAPPVEDPYLNTDSFRTRKAERSTKP